MLSWMRANTVSPASSRRAWLWATFETILGAILSLGCSAIHSARSSPFYEGWVGMVGLILLLHFGTLPDRRSAMAELSASKPNPSCRRRLRSTSLGEFWGKRWNLGFRQLAHELIFRPLCIERFGAGTGWFPGLRGFRADPRLGDLAACSRRLWSPHALLLAARHRSDDRAFAVRQAVRAGTRSWQRLVFHDAVPRWYPSFGLFHPWFVLRVILPFMQSHSRAMTECTCCCGSLTSTCGSSARPIF